MTTNRVPITIELSSSQYQLIKSMAAKRSSPDRVVKIHNLVEQLVERALLPMSARQYDVAHRDLSITELHQAKLNDQEIARRLHCNPGTVFRTRHRLGLGRNDPRGGDRRPNRGA